jgi:uncharacterized membrane protein
MALFNFVSVWKIGAPLEPVWDLLYRLEEWPAWWKGVEKVEILRPGDANRLCLQTRQTWKSSLPYELHFETCVTHIDPMALIEVWSVGELDGKGSMKFARDGINSIFQVEWNVRTTAAWMTLLSPILAPAFSWNHKTIMDWGAESLAKKIGASGVTTSTEAVL